MYKTLLISLVSLFWLCSSTVAQNETDADMPRLRSCRMGKVNPKSKWHRARTFQNSENPYIGSRRQLVVLAAFKDQPFSGTPESELEKWGNIFNTRNYNKGNYSGSVCDYFLNQSYGQFFLTFDLVYIELPDERKKYRSTESDDENSQYMVDDIVDVLEKQDINWSVYDWDGDSFVDQLLIIYAGMGMNSGGDMNTIWPHQWWLSYHENLETEDNSDFRTFRTVQSGDKNYHIDSYCCVQEIADKTGNQSTFGTICHEYSHCFGLPDFYTYSSSVVYEWDLMDYGNYNNNGFRPCSYSAHERMVMGWLTPIELTCPTNINDMPALNDEPVAYLIRNDGWEDEFYIVENRHRTGWDQDLPGSGILIFHVDYDKELWNSIYEMPNTLSKNRYHILPANNSTRRTRTSNWTYPYITTDTQGNDSIANNCLTDTSLPAAKLNHPNANGKMLISKPITKMAVDANGLASFTFMDNTAQSVNQVSAKGHANDRWYLPDGRKLQGRPTTHGLYICNGRKVAIR